jgi:hypothetical protein
LPLVVGLDCGAQRKDAPERIGREGPLRKSDRVRFLLDKGASPKEAAKEANCAFSLAYKARAFSGMARVEHDIAVIRRSLEEIDARLHRLESNPKDIIQLMLAEELKR